MENDGDEYAAHRLVAVGQVELDVFLATRTALHASPVSRRETGSQPGGNSSAARINDVPNSSAMKERR